MENKLDCTLEEWMDLEIFKEEDYARLLHEPEYEYPKKRFSFEKLVVWQKAVELVTWIYQATRQFPDAERYSLTSQIRRSAISTPTNIAEGVARRSEKEKVRFLTIAYGSQIELLNHLIISRNLGFIQPDDLAEGRRRIQEITAMIQALARSFNA